MASAKPMRLNKAAREFNISTQTIVEFLGKKGYAIDAKPNTKLDIEMVELLEKEFQLDKRVKEEAHEKVFDYADNESVTIKDIQDSKETATNDEYQEDVIIQSGIDLGTSDSDRTSEPVEEPKNTAKEEPPEEIIEEPVTEEKPIVKEDKPVAEEKEPEIKKDEPVKDEPVLADDTIAENEPETVVEEKKTEQEPPVEKVTTKDIEKDIDKPVNTEETKEEITSSTTKKEEKEEPVADTKSDTAKEKEEPTTKEKTEDKPQPKVIGKIDLNSINQKTRPDKKSKAQRRRRLRKEKQRLLKRKLLTIQNTRLQKQNKVISKILKKRVSPTNQSKRRKKLTFLKQNILKLKGQPY